MATILNPIALDEMSYNVALLQKALAALELPVSQDEVAENRAGETTLKQVRILQATLHVPVDESTLVNEVTAVAIGDTLKKMGLTTASRSFTVTGAARLDNGEPQGRLQLLAFDLDLRGVAVYRTVTEVAEIKEIGGFEYLGQAVTDRQGHYTIRFYDWQYQQLERKKADVVVYALDGEKIVGHSRLINSDDYSDQGMVRDLDVLVTQEDQRTEYETLMTVLETFLQDNKTTLVDIAASSDQLIFTAGELELDQSHLDIAAAAALLLRQERKRHGHEMLYGLGRQNIRLAWDALYKQQTGELQAAIARSVNERIIREPNPRDLAAFLEFISESTAQHLLSDRDNDPNTLSAMLKNALPEEKQRLSFVTALGNFEGGNFGEFWDNHLPTQPEFKDNKLVSALLLTQQFTLLTGNHQRLVKELQVDRNVTSMDQLITMDKGDWLELLEKTGVPEFVAGNSDADKKDRYCQPDARTAQRCLPHPTHRPHGGKR